MSGRREWSLLKQFRPGGSRPGAPIKTPVRSIGLKIGRIQQIGTSRTTSRILATRPWHAVEPGAFRSSQNRGGRDGVVSPFSHGRPPIATHRGYETKPRWRLGRRKRRLLSPVAGLAIVAGTTGPRFERCGTAASVNESLAHASGSCAFPRSRFGLVCISSLTLRARVHFLAHASGSCAFPNPLAIGKTQAAIAFTGRRAGDCRERLVRGSNDVERRRLSTNPSLTLRARVHFLAHASGSCAER
jgi:hypothetical protein